MKNGLQKGGRVVISYAPLWETMKKRGVTTYALINKHGVSPYTVRVPASVFFGGSQEGERLLQNMAKRVKRSLYFATAMPMGWRDGLLLRSFAKIDEASGVMRLKD